MANKGVGEGGQNYIVDIEKKVSGLSRRAKNKERGIGFRGNETNSLNKCGEALKPCMWCLFETVERLLEKTHKIRMGRIYITKWLLTIDGLIESAMQKSVFNIKLMNRPRGRYNKTKNNANSAWFDNR